MSGHATPVLRFLESVSLCRCTDRSEIQKFRNILLLRVYMKKNMYQEKKFKITKLINLSNKYFFIYILISIF